jgi:hypothetical protein
MEHVVARLARDAFRDMFGAREDLARSFPLDLRFTIEPGEEWCVKADPDLREQLRQAVREMAVQTEAFRPGRVYCHRCESAECAHGVPPGSTSVFGGYNSTGLPRWSEFAQVLLDLRHPGVEQLFEASRPDLVAAYMDGEPLKVSQLDVFGRQSKAHDILGQVIFGLVRVPCGQERSDPFERTAFTLQVVESRKLDGSPRLDLNVLGRLGNGSPAVESLSGPHQTRLLDVIGEVRRRIQHLAPARGGAKGTVVPALPKDTSDRVERVLRETARRLERISRQTGRRTAHAEKRREANRPTSNAWADVGAVPAERILWDERKKTVVILGPRQRVHIFSRDGRHVTSLLLDGEAVEARVRRRRWRPLEGDLVALFRAAVGRFRGEMEGQGDGAKEAVERRSFRRSWT